MLLSFHIWNLFRNNKDDKPKTIIQEAKTVRKKAEKKRKKAEKMGKLELISSLY